MHLAIHLRDDIDRFYVLRKGGGRRLANIEHCVKVSSQEFEDYIKNSDETLVTAANRSNKLRKEKVHFKGETKSLLIAAQNNAIRTNYVKAKIGNA